MAFLLDTNIAIWIGDRHPAIGQQVAALSGPQRLSIVTVVELEGGIVAQINSSWNFRVYRDELFSMQVDGTLGSAVAGLRECRAQHRVNTPRPTWNPDIPNPFNFRDDWMDVPDNASFDNGFKVQWELFLRHVAEDGPWKHGLLEGAKGVQLAELGLKSWEERRWIDVPSLNATGDKAS